MEHVKSCQKKKIRRIFDCLFQISSLCLYTGGQLNPPSAGFLLALAKQGDSVAFSTPRLLGKSGWKKSQKFLVQSAAQSYEVRPGYSGIYPGSVWKSPRTETAQTLELGKALTLFYCPSKRAGEKKKSLNMRTSLQWKRPLKCVFHWMRKGDKLFFVELVIFLFLMATNLEYQWVWINFNFWRFPLNLYLSGKLYKNTISVSVCATYLQILKNGKNFLFKGECFTLSIILGHRRLDGGVEYQLFTESKDLF